MAGAAKLALKLSLTDTGSFGLLDGPVPSSLQGRFGECTFEKWSYSPALVRLLERDMHSTDRRAIAFTVLYFCHEVDHGWCLLPGFRCGSIETGASRA